MKLILRAHLRSATTTTYYHVTPHTRTPKILQEGLVPGKRRQWSNQMGQTIGVKNKVFLMKDLDSAIRFAHKLQYGTGKPVDILRIEADIPDIEQDPHVEGQMAGHTWLMTSQPVAADCIKEVTALTPDVIKDFIKRYQARYN